MRKVHLCDVLIKSLKAIITAMGSERNYLDWFWIISTAVIALPGWLDIALPGK